MTAVPPRSSPWLWEEFVPGLTFPPVTLCVTAEASRLWVEQGGPENGGLLPLMVPLMIRGFIAVSSPRLPGNVHVSQSLDFPARAPHLNEPLEFRYRINDRIERRGRGWVTIGVETTAIACGTRLMRGEMVMIWAGRRCADDDAQDKARAGQTGSLDDAPAGRASPGRSSDASDKAPSCPVDSQATGGASLGKASECPTGTSSACDSADAPSGPLRGMH